MVIFHSYVSLPEGIGDYSEFLADMKLFFIYVFQSFFFPEYV